MVVRVDCIFHRVCDLEIISVFLETKKNIKYLGEKPTKDKLIAAINILTFKVHFNNICKKLFLQLIVQKKW